MFCSQCGNKSSDKDVFCANCGNELGKAFTESGASISPTKITQDLDNHDIFLTHKSIIDGRMSRKEFAIITIAPYLLAIIYLLITGTTAFPIFIVWLLFGYFASIRRLHDLNKSAWWLLLLVIAGAALIIKEGLKLVGIDTGAIDITVIGMLVNITAIAGFFLFLSLLFVKGTKGENRYGLPVVDRKLTWRGVLLNLHSEKEKLDLTYLLYSISIYLGLLLILTAIFLS